MGTDHRSLPYETSWAYCHLWSMRPSLKLGTRELCTKLKISISALEAMMATLDYQSLHQVDPMSVHAGTERILYASL